MKIICPLKPVHSSSILKFAICQTRDTCVFASIASAINHLSNSQVWDEDTLYNKNRNSKNPGSNFASVISTAIEPVTDSITYNIEDDNNIPPTEDYIISHLEKRGIVIASLQLADKTTPYYRIRDHHMLTFIKNNGEYYIWDTNKQEGIISRSNLIDVIIIGTTTINYSNKGILRNHVKHEILFLNNKKG